MKKTLHVVHCVDTEGPLTEPVEATFDRLRKEKGIELKPSKATLEGLQNKTIDLNGREQEIAEYVAPGRLAYLSTWDEVGKMVKKITSKEFREKFSDSENNPYLFSWFIIDIVGYLNNPREKAVGFHNVWDHYMEFLKDSKFNDCFGWHFHTVPVNRNAIEYNASFTNNDYHEQSICRRIIERNWYPTMFRAGGWIQRNDLSYWLEQFIPIDYSNRSQTYKPAGHPGSQCDWRGAPMEWSYYHPNFYDYRKEGDMRRAIFRCLDVDVPMSKLTEDEVRSAFSRAERGDKAILAYTNHDRRDISIDVEKAYQLITKVSKDFPDVSFKFSNALDAAKDSLGMLNKNDEKLEFSLELKEDLLYITSNQDIFGPQPFIAVEEEGDLFYRVNSTRENDREWVYRVERKKSVKTVGVGGNNNFGESSVSVLKIS